MEVKKQTYNAYVKKITPTHNLWMEVGKAFLVGGIICVIGQALNNSFLSMGMEKEEAGVWMLIALIFFSITLTGFNLFSKIAAFGGAGALVPITGFANSMVSPAIEYQAEGQVFGIGCKIFTIAGPVILYGVLTSWLLGLCYWGAKMMGMM